MGVNRRMEKGRGQSGSRGVGETAKSELCYNVIVTLLIHRGLHHNFVVQKISVYLLTVPLEYGFP